MADNNDRQNRDFDLKMKIWQMCHLMRRLKQESWYNSTSLYLHMYVYAQKL